MSERKQGAALVFMTAIAAPIAFGLETVMRKLLFPADFELVREWLAVPMTVLACVLAIVATALAAFAPKLQARFETQAVQKIPPDARSPDRVARARNGTFLLASSIVQLPAIAATLTYMFGAAIAPVLVALVASTFGVAVQGARALRRVSPGGERSGVS